MSHPVKVPTPKPPGHPKLARGRVEVNISRSTDRLQTSGRPVWTVVATGRFVTEQAARRWAEATRAPGQHAQLTRYSAIDGWRPHAMPGVLTDAGWSDAVALLWLAGTIHLSTDGEVALCGVERGSHPRVDPAIVNSPACSRCEAARP